RHRDVQHQRQEPTRLRDSDGIRVTYTLPAGAVPQTGGWNGSPTLTIPFPGLVLQPHELVLVVLRVQFNQAGTAANHFSVAADETDVVSANNDVVVNVTVAQPTPSTTTTTTTTTTSTTPIPTPKGVHRTGNGKANTLTGTKYADVLRGMG